MVQLGSGAKRSVKDYMLTQYASYLIAQNSNSQKEESHLPNAISRCKPENRNCGSGREATRK